MHTDSGVIGQFEALTRRNSSWRGTKKGICLKISGQRTFITISSWITCCTIIISHCLKQLTAVFTAFRNTVASNVRCQSIFVSELFACPRNKVYLSLLSRYLCSCQYSLCCESVSVQASLCINAADMRFLWLLYEETIFYVGMNKVITFLFEICSHVFAYNCNLCWKLARDDNSVLVCFLN